MATELTPGVPLERKGNVSCLLQGCGCYGLIWLAVPSFQGLLNLCITSRPLLAISDMHLSSVRKKKTTPNFVPPSFFPGWGATPYFSIGILRVSAPLLLTEQLKAQKAATEVGRNYRTELRELIRISRSKDRDTLLRLCFPPALSGKSQPRL